MINDIILKNVSSMCFKAFPNTACVISPAHLVPLDFALGFYNTCIFGGFF